jgi:hypothetical protein
MVPSDLLMGTLLMAVNACLAVGFGWPLSRQLAQAANRPRGVASWRVILLGLYVLEGVAFSASMATNVLGLLLAAVWGLLLRWLFGNNSRDTLWRLGLKVGLYSSLPAVSFLSILPVLATRWSLISSQAGRQFGIPSFVPWPVSTLLGFFLTVALSAMILKTALTAGIARLWQRRATSARGSTTSRPTASRG